MRKGHVTADVILSCWPAKTPFAVIPGNKKNVRPQAPLRISVKLVDIRLFI
jgi:hypothetical protein